MQLPSAVPAHRAHRAHPDHRDHRARPARLHSVFERTLHEERRALIGWAIGLAALAVTMLAMYPTVRGNQDISQLIDSYPKTFKSLFGVYDYTSGPGYLRAEVFSLMGPLLLTIFGVLWGSDLTAGEEERRTIDVLLANPVSRGRVLVEKWAALVVGQAVAAATLGIVLVAGAPVAGLHIGWGPLWAAVVASALLGLLFGTVALALGAATGHRGLARGVTAMIAVVAYLLSSLADIVTWVRRVRPVSPWYHAIGVDPLTTGFRPGHLLIVVAMIVVVVAIAAAAFDRRDLGV